MEIIIADTYEEMSKLCANMIGHQLLRKPGSVLGLATTKLDFPLIMGITVFITLMTLFANLITDLTYAYIDPRIRVE